MVAGGGVVGETGGRKGRREEVGAQLRGGEVPALGMGFMV